MSDALLSLYEELDQTAARIMSEYPFIPCKAGCSDCCHHSAFLVSQTEADYLIQGIASERKKVLRRRAKKELERFHHAVGYGAWTEIVVRVAKHKLVCPLLEDGICTVYERRPLICRAYSVHALMEDGRKGIYGCDKVRRAIFTHILQGGSVLLPDFAELGEKREGVLYGDLKPLASWIAMC